MFCRVYIRIGGGILFCCCFFYRVRLIWFGLGWVGMDWDLGNWDSGFGVELVASFFVGGRDGGEGVGEFGGGFFEHYCCCCLDGCGRGWEIWDGGGYVCVMGDDWLWD